MLESDLIMSTWNEAPYMRSLHSGANLSKLFTSQASRQLLFKNLPVLFEGALISIYSASLSQTSFFQDLQEPVLKQIIIETAFFLHWLSPEMHHDQIYLLTSPCSVRGKFEIQSRAGLDLMRQGQSWDLFGYLMQVCHPSLLIVHNHWPIRCSSLLSVW